MTPRRGAAGNGRSLTVLGVAVSAGLVVALSFLAPTPAQATWRAQVSGGPAVAMISPNRGPATGGSAMMINGEGFDDTTAVTFGGVPAPGFDVMAGSGGRVMNVIAPAHARGPVAVMVTTSAGTSPAAPAGTFTYQPVRGQWTALEATRRFSHTATLLADGRVLVAGGCLQPEPSGQCAQATATATLYDPARRSWTPVPDMATARISHLATLLPDGRVLVSGGCSKLDCYPACPTDCPDVSPSKTSAEIFDPVTGRWTPTGNMAFSQQQGASVLLPGGPASVCGPNCGKVLVVGKGATLTGETPPTDAELYDPRSGTWSPTAPTVHPRTFPAAVVLRSGKVLLASTAIDQPLNAIPGELYDPATGTWAPTGNAELTPSIGETATLLPDGRVLAIAADPYGIGKEVELYDPTALPDPTNPAVRGGAWKATAGPTEGRTRNTATRLGDGTILIVGGNRPPVATAELYDEKTATWASAGTMAGARSLDPIQSTGQPTFTATLLKDGTVLVVGASYQVSRLTTTFNSHVINGFKVTDPAQYGPSAELYTPGSGDSGSAPRTFVLVLGGAAALAVLAAVALARRRNQRPGERVETAPG